MGAGQVTILGINGHIGQAAAKAFVAAGWQVTGMGRSDRHHTPGVRFVAGDADSVTDMRRAIGESEVVLNALNLRYDLWFDGRMEGQTARVVEAMGATGKTLLFPGNIYNFSRTDRVIAPQTPQRPETVRGQLRVRVEQRLEAAAARGDIQLLILRAGDFYGPQSSGDWFDLAMMRDVRKGVVRTLGARGVPHAWAYLPDLGRAFEALAALRHSLNSVEHFHFAGHFVTPEQMGAALAAAAPAPIKVRPFPMLLLVAGGWVNPVLRETAKMRYLWQSPMQLRDERLNEILGAGFGAPFDVAVAATAAPLFAAMRGEEPRRLAVA